MCRSLHLIVFWILFENVMSLHRTKATFVGLFDLGRVNEWIVTEKLGDALKSRLVKLGKRSRMKFGERYPFLFLPPKLPAHGDMHMDLSSQSMHVPF